MEHPAQKVYLGVIGAALSEARLAHVAVGSAALNLHGADLELPDLDLLVANRVGDQPRIAAALQALGTRPQLIEQAQAELCGRPGRAQVRTAAGVLDLRDGERFLRPDSLNWESFDQLLAEAHTEAPSGLATLSLQGHRGQLNDCAYDLYERAQNELVRRAPQLGYEDPEQLAGELEDLRGLAQQNPAAEMQLLEHEEAYSIAYPTASRRVEQRLELIDTLIAGEPELTRRAPQDQLTQAPERGPSLPPAEDGFELGF